jgi:RNA-directed DNA polymerase
MAVWRPQSYRQRGRELVIDPTVLDNATAIGAAIIAVNPALPPVFSLRHLAYLTDVSYEMLRDIVSRSPREPYRIFRIQKRPAELGEHRYRTICAPEPGLLRVQRWIAQRILRYGHPHHASVAYAKGDTIYAAAQPHCRCRWLIKLDVRNFFESIPEIAAYRVFQELGYQPLPAFELARLCTRLGTATPLRRRKRWRVDPQKYVAITACQHHRMGHLPQGAPTSPMLANLAVRAFDEAVSEIADRHGLVYTRYADDLTLSTRDEAFDRKLVFRLIHLHPAARLASAFLARLRLRVIDRGVAVQTKGFGLAFR